jgi:hypothetical protein
MAAIISDLTETYLFDSPEIEIYQRNQSLISAPSCENKLVSGSFFSVANNPRHGTKINKPISGDVEYSVFTTTSTFSSSMNNCRIRFFDLEIDNLNYEDIRGISNLFSGTTQSEFVASVKKVVAAKALMLDRPISISNVSLKNNTKEEASSYFERKSTYYSTNIKSGKYEIIHTPITPAESLITSELVVPEIIINLKNLKFNSVPKTFRLLKQSLNVPGTDVVISAGDITSYEVLTCHNINPELRKAGYFYNGEVLSSYWLSTNLISLSYTPEKLIDSITISASGIENENEADYIIFKENTPDGSGRTAEYVSTTYQTGSEWYTSPELFPNFAISPEVFYSCSLADPYVQSVEVNYSGSAYNSNSIKLYKDVSYELCFDWSKIRKTSDDFSLVVYFISTSPNGYVRKHLIGKLDKSHVNQSAGKYKNVFTTKITHYGTIIIVPKFISFATIANISIKPHQSDEYAIDFLSINFPIDSIITNEKIKLTIDFFDAGGEKCSKTLEKIAYLDSNGYTQQKYGSGAGGGLILDGGGP